MRCRSGEVDGGAEAGSWELSTSTDGGSNQEGSSDSVSA